MAELNWMFVKIGVPVWLLLMLGWFFVGWYRANLLRDVHSETADLRAKQKKPL
ncbi:hypothetical protein [Deinococcus roseus]|uniref:hypothetical protein n=1 Tax=Deinococcus roseus TaxID=392414 RepID=UPI00166655FA|nr:hypothetical protein [Deinococcus roseus]